MHAAGLNAASFAGHTDWRVPNLKELQSIFDYERIDPAVDPVFNTGCVSLCTVTTCSCTLSHLYWSSTSDTFGPSSAWEVDFVDGGVFINGKSIDGFFVRAVRGSL